MILSSNLGYPRIGSNRELKWLLESFWKKEINEDYLFKKISEIKKSNWIKQKKSGINYIPSNDFSLYDHVLDMCLTLNVIPDRFNKLKKEISKLTPYESLVVAKSFSRFLDLTNIAESLYSIQNIHDHNIRKIQETNEIVILEEALIDVQKKPKLSIDKAVLLTVQWYKSFKSKKNLFQLTSQQISNYLTK